MDWVWRCSIDSKPTTNPESGKDKKHQLPV